LFSVEAKESEAAQAKERDSVGQRELPLIERDCGFYVALGHMEVEWRQAFPVRTDFSAK